MRIRDVGGALRHRWYLMILVLALAAVAAVGLRQQARGIPQGTATVQILVDSPVSALVNLKSDPAGLETRAAVLAQAMASSQALAYMARSAGVPSAELTAEGPFSGAAQTLNVQTPSEARGVQLVAAQARYHLVFVPQQQIPIVTAQVTAPSAVAAARLANAILPGAVAWLDSIESPQQQQQSGSAVDLRQLGNAQVGTINSSTPQLVAGLAAVAVLVLGILAIAMLDHGLSRRPGAAAADLWRVQDELVESSGSDGVVRSVPEEDVPRAGEDVRPLGARMAVASRALVGDHTHSG